jgi:hypothetical protein
LADMFGLLNELNVSRQGHSFIHHRFVWQNEKRHTCFQLPLSLKRMNLTQIWTKVHFCLVSKRNCQRVS